MPMHNPPHPGQFIRDEIIDANGLSVTAAAEILKVGRSALSNLLNGHADLSPEMALRIEMAFGVGMDTLMRMQTAYDAAKVRRRAGSIRVRRFEPAAAAWTMQRPATAGGLPCRLQRFGIRRRPSRARFQLARVVHKRVAHKGVVSFQPGLYHGGHRLEDSCCQIT